MGKGELQGQLEGQGEQPGAPFERGAQGKELGHSGGIKPLLLRIERSQWRWLGYLFGILH